MNSQSRAHFINNHETVEMSSPTRFVCQICFTGGVGLRHYCPTCQLVLHRYCQMCSGESICRLHRPSPSGKSEGHQARCVAIHGSSVCMFCRDEIATGAMAYSCKNYFAPDCFAHPLCFLVQKKTEFPEDTPIDNHGHAIGNYYGGHYTCVTCGQPGFGRLLRCETCNDDYHPFCAHSSLEHRSRTCFIHPDSSSHTMIWMRSSLYQNKPDCGLCLQKVTGYYYKCIGAGNGSSDLHPMCAERLRQDRMFHKKREAFGKIIEGLSLGIRITNSMSHLVTFFNN